MLDPTSPEGINAFAAAQVVRELLILGEAVFSRSVPDVFPFFLEGVEAYHDAEALFGGFQSLFVQNNPEIPTNHPLLT